jgi:hypothetical protein
MFVGSIFGKPSRDFIRPLLSPRDLKGLLHTLNVIVYPTKEKFILFFFSLFFVWYC